MHVGDVANVTKKSGHASRIKQHAFKEYLISKRKHYWRSR